MPPATISLFNNFTRKKKEALMHSTVAKTFSLRGCYPKKNTHTNKIIPYFTQANTDKKKRLLLVQFYQRVKRHTMSQEFKLYDDLELSAETKENPIKPLAVIDGDILLDKILMVIDRGDIAEISLLLQQEPIHVYTAFLRTIENGNLKLVQHILPFIKVDDLMEMCPGPLLSYSFEKTSSQVSAFLSDKIRF